jgi:hypothetical protein
MSEKLSYSPEQQHEAPNVRVERPRAAEYSPAEQAEHIKRAEAAVAAETSKTEQPQLPKLEPTDDRPLLIDNAIKTLRMRRNLAHVQKRLKPAQKSLSKVIHQPLVQRTSEAAAVTVTRPSGLLGGGITAFIGSLIYAYLSRSAGFTYNYTMFLCFFVGGFAFGVAVEFVLHWVAQRKRLHR